MLWPKILTSRSAIFLLGAASVAVWKAAAPVIAGTLRPLAREAIKGGIMLGRTVQTLVDEVREELEDIAAEAQADLAAAQEEEKTPKNKKAEEA